MAGARRASADRNLIGYEREKQHAANSDRLPPRLQAHEDEAGIQDANGRHTDCDTEWAACSSSEGHAAEDCSGQDVQLEATAYGWRNTTEPSGDQNCNEPNQKTVDGIKPDDRAGNRNAAEFSRPRVAADSAEGEPSHAAGKDEIDDKEEGDRDNNRILDFPHLAPSEFQQRWWETVDRYAANDVGETAIEGQHGECHNQRGDAQLAH